MKVRLTGKFKYVRQDLKMFSEKQINEEVMFFQSSLDFVYSNCNLITKYILDQITKSTDYKKLVNSNPKLNIIIDSRINSLVPGQWPSVPGWHCDDIYRESREVYTQPDISNLSRKSYHFMVLCSEKDAICSTEFITGTHEFDLDTSTVYNSLNKIINAAKIPTKFVKSNAIVLFDNLSVHRATQAKLPGIRLFFRLSLTYREPKNIIRRNVTNYADVNEAGW